MTGRPRKEIVNKKYGMLLILADQGETCLCKCDCGKTATLNRADIMRGHVKSCGCRKGNPKHKMKHTRIYTIWIQMKARCYNPNNIEFKRYGQRGIEVCEEWENDFVAFHDWAMANGYSDELSIDRIDVNGNYEPSNCRWATVLEQGSNKRNNRILTVDGESLTLSQWERKLNIKHSTMCNWLRRKGEDYAIDRIKAAMADKAM